MEAYETRLKWYRIEAGTVRKYEEKGREKGLAEGIVAGKAEERKQIALNMLNDNLPITTITKVTGLTIAQINELAKTIDDK